MTWLINTCTFQLREFARCAPPYATFSYVTDENEASFEDFAQTNRGPCKDSTKIIARACEEARNAGFEWLWNHAACVDKRSSAAQSEAINSMAQIYRDCEYSLVYLEEFDGEPAGDETIGQTLAACRWIKNIWSIPQIIFPREIHFFSSLWTQIGSKGSLLQDLSSIIGIDESVLQDSDCLEDYSIARRMSWASEMTAFRTEDYAYALFGLFDVSMPVIYGEGRKAFIRLQEEIIRDTDDFSLLAWDSFDLQEYHGLFAFSPACFRRFRHGSTTALRINGDAQIHCTGITIQTCLLKTETGLFLPLEGQDGSMCCIPLSSWNRRFVRRNSPVEWNLSGQMTLDSMRICVKRDVSAHLSRKISEHGEFVRDRSSEPLDESGTARASRCSVVNYNSNDETGSMGPSVEDRGTASQYAPSVSVSEVTSQDDLALSLYERGSVEGRGSALESDVRPLWVNGITSEVYYGPENGPFDDGGGVEIHSPDSGFESQQVVDGSQNIVHSNGSPSTEAEVLDVAQAAKELADIALEQFHSGRQRQSNKRLFIPWQSENRKRPKLMQSSDQLEVVDTSDFEDGETVLINKSRFFACPFYVRNNKHTNCVTRHALHSIEEVKEHLCWEHRRPMFCPVCKEEFPSGRDRDAHIRLRVCHANTSAIPEGITDDQEEQLNREGKLTLSEDLRWFQIWDILFPHVERPSSTFYTSEREVSVCAFRQFWMQGGEEVVAAFLEEKRCQNYGIRDEERKLRAIYDRVVEKVVDRIFADFSDTGKR